MKTLRNYIDPYLLLLIGTVGVAFLLPARGGAQIVADNAVIVAVGLLFFLYGARLSPSTVWAGISHWRLQGLVFISTFVLFPCVGLLVRAAAGTHLSPDVGIGLIYLCLLPSTVQSSIAFTSIARGNVPAALCSASVSNLLGVVITPLLVGIVLPALGLTPAGNSMSPHKIEDIALQILAPFVAGQILRPWISGWLGRHKTLTSFVDRGSILLVVYAAFSAGMTAGVWSRLAMSDLLVVLALDLVILAIVIVTTTGVSRALGFSKEDEIAIVFCGSKKSMAGGVPMATILFAGHAVSLIVLPLMLFHQAQLFVCATMARRYARRMEAAEAPAGLAKAA